MANAGINKAQVKKARDALIAKGVHPSIDSVRVELGNTGSKNTIHRYLKELNEESDTLNDGKVALSDTLSELVSGLAAQLHAEAAEVVENAKASSQATIEVLQSKVNLVERALTEARSQLDTVETQLKSAHETRLVALDESQKHLLTIERLTQELRDKDTQIAAKNDHIQSLEEKHQHSRQALEHYRDSVKEQREQDQRRHETQVQQLQAEIRLLNQTISIKQTDVTQLNTDNSRLATEVRELRKQLSESTHKLEKLEHQLKGSEEKLIAATHQGARLNELLSENQRIAAELSEHKQATKLIEIQLASTITELNVKSQLLESLGSQFAQAVRNA
jgi:chromosome segregation ATPase